MLKNQYMITIVWDVIRLHPLTRGRRGVEIKDVSIPTVRWRHLLIYEFFHKFLFSNKMPATRRSKISKGASHLQSYNTTLIFKSLGFNSTQYEKHFFLSRQLLQQNFPLLLFIYFFRVWLIVAGRGSRVQCRGRGSKVAVAGPMSRSRVQSRGRGSNVAAGENDLEFEVTEWKRVIWKKYKREKNRFYAWYSTLTNLQVTDVRVNNFCVHRKFILFSFYRAQLCINSALNVLMHNGFW